MNNIPYPIKINKSGENDINRVKVDTGSTFVIPYKNWEKIIKQSSVFRVPIEFCKYRLENGRIRTQILSHEKTRGKLDAEELETQKLISSFLGKSDPKTNEDLKMILKKEGQKQPAVITADGFLINGNRRKWALEQLYLQEKDDEYKYMKVVILPGSGDPESPTPMDIALLENRYQVHVDGKSEYTVMNKALTYKEHVDNGIPLEQLLRDDPTFGDPNNSDFNEKVKSFKKQYFEPLELMQQYLADIGMDGDYNLVQDRWESFVETQKYIVDKLNKPKNLVEFNLQEQDKAKVLQATFNIIKVDDISEIETRRTDIIRKIIPAYIKNDKKEVFKIAAIENNNDPSKDVYQNFVEWQDNQGQQILNSLKKLQNITQWKDEKETPLKRLNEALQKLNHEVLEPEQLSRMPGKPDATEALKLTNQIEKINKKLQTFFYYRVKDDEDKLQQLIKKWNQD